MIHSDLTWKNTQRMTKLAAEENFKKLRETELALLGVPILRI
jgi:hypothetical protein